MGKVFGFNTRIVNPASYINKVTGKEKLFGSTPFEETTKFVLLNATIPVGILIDKGISDIKNVFLPVFNADDDFLLIMPKDW